MAINQNVDIKKLIQELTLQGTCPKQTLDQLLDELNTIKLDELPSFQENLQGKEPLNLNNCMKSNEIKSMASNFTWNKNQIKQCVRKLSIPAVAFAIIEMGYSYYQEQDNDRLIQQIISNQQTIINQCKKTHK